ncbi:MAG: hypothetical protein KDC00_05620 [Flavobacteriales bacterium]|nr:hypothetical protein [Flavobacteriales bacterium]
MSTIGPFVVLMLLTNIAFGLITAALFLRFQDRLRLPVGPLALTGLGLGPFLLSVVLYYALLLFPGIPRPALLVLPVLAFGLLAWIAGPGWGGLRGWITELMRALRDPSIWLFLLGSAGLLVVTVLFLANKPLVDHDVLEYGVQGRIFLRDGAIRYSQFRFDEASGFHYVGLHGFAFPLLFTWEGLWAWVLRAPSDLWARSITMWYGWLIIVFVWSVFRQVDRWMAVAGSIALAASVGFLFLVTIYHLDSFRIFFFTTSMAAFVALFRAPSRARVLLLAVLCAAVGFIHSIGAILCVVLWGVVLLLLPVPIMQRLRWTVPAVGVMLLLGGVHYVLDVLIGTGWILQDIIWY